MPSLEYFTEKLAKRHAPIKAVLLDQQGVSSSAIKALFIYFSFLVSRNSFTEIILLISR